MEQMPPQQIGYLLEIESLLPNYFAGTGSAFELKKTISLPFDSEIRVGRDSIRNKGMPVLQIPQHFPGRNYTSADHLTIYFTQNAVDVLCHGANGARCAELGSYDLSLAWKEMQKGNDVRFSQPLQGRKIVVQWPIVKRISDKTEPSYEARISAVSQT